MTPEPFTYRARVERVVDGDTLIMQIDLGFHMTAKVSVRLLGVDTPELRGGTDESKQRARNAKAFTDVWCNEAVGLPAPADEWAEWPFRVTTSKGDSFGRWLGRVYAVRTGDELSAALVDSGHGIAL
jgi:micrococcal nuclease